MYQDSSVNKVRYYDLDGWASDIDRAMDFLLRHHVRMWGPPSREWYLDTGTTLNFT
jgi:hypothetical protein